MARIAATSVQAVGSIQDPGTDSLLPRNSPPASPASGFKALSGAPAAVHGAQSASTSTSNQERALHRVAEVRRQQGISERTVARRLGVDIKCYRRFECPTEDLKLSELLRLQQALDVPLIDLLEDPQALSRPVEERAKLVKIMKTAVALRETKSNARVERMAHMLCEQLVDLMPELAEVGGWPQFGARRGTAAIGRTLSTPVDTSQIRMDN